MPRVESSVELPFPVGRLFAFLSRPADRIAVAPPDLNLQLVEAPEVLALGARVTVRVRSYGMSRLLVSEVTAFEADVRIVEEQRDGPFRAWTQTQSFTALDATTTRLADVVEFEPPTGLLGRFLSAASVERDLRAAFAFRDAALLQRLGE